MLFKYPMSFNLCRYYLRIQRSIIGCKLQVKYKGNNVPNDWYSPLGGFSMLQPLSHLTEQNCNVKSNGFYSMKIELSDYLNNFRKSRTHKKLLTKPIPNEDIEVYLSYETNILVVWLVLALNPYLKTQLY